MSTIRASIGGLLVFGVFSSPLRLFFNFSSISIMTQSCESPLPSMQHSELTAPLTSFGRSDPRRWHPFVLRIHSLSPCDGHFYGVVLHHHWCVVSQYLTWCTRANSSSSNPSWAGDPVQDVVSHLYCCDRRAVRGLRMGCSDLLPLLPGQIDAIPHPDHNDYQCPDALACRLFHNPCGGHPSSWPMLQSFKAKDV